MPFHSAWQQLIRSVHVHMCVCVNRTIMKLGNWAIGQLENWAIGQLEYWKIGQLENWTAGILENWTTGELDNWTAGILEYWLRRNFGGFDICTHAHLLTLTHPKQPKTALGQS